MVNSNRTVTFRQILKNKSFLALWLEQFANNFGDWLAFLALFSLVAFHLHATPYQVSWIMICLTAPTAFLGPIAGVFVDRSNLKTMMIVSDLLRAFLAILLAFATELYHIYLLVFVLSAISCFFRPAHSVVFRQLVRKEELLVANVLTTQSSQFNKVISPAVAGLLIAWVGEKACFYIDSLTFVFSAAVLSIIIIRREQADLNKGIGSIVKELVEGLKFILNRRALLFVIISMVMTIFAVGAFDALAAVYVRDILFVKSQFFGALVSLVGIGTILGGLLVSRVGGSHSKVNLVVLGVFGIGIGIFVLAASGEVIVALLCGLWLGLGAANVLIPSQTLMQEETPPTMLGRVSSTSTSLITIAQLLAVSIAGTVANWIGIKYVYYLVAGILILTAFFGYLYAKISRTMKVQPLLL